MPTAASQPKSISRICLHWHVAMWHYNVTMLYCHYNVSSLAEQSWSVKYLTMWHGTWLDLDQQWCTILVSDATIHNICNIMWRFCVSIHPFVRKQHHSPCTACRRPDQCRLAWQSATHSAEWAGWAFSSPSMLWFAV